MASCASKADEGAAPPKIDLQPAASLQASAERPHKEIALEQPDTAPEPSPDDLVDIREIDDSIALDMRYATSNNFTGVAVYPVARCLLRRDVAMRLARVQAALKKRRLGLKLWDCYRPISVQMKFWKLVPKASYVAKPVVENGVAIKGSKHNRGAAVDLTLVDGNGAEIEMPTEYDDFTERAHRGYRGASKAARRNAKILEDAMVAEGFLPMRSEWWHFDGPNWRRYPLEDVPLSEPEPRPQRPEPRP